MKNVVEQEAAERSGAQSDEQQQAVRGGIFGPGDEEPQSIELQHNLSFIPAAYVMTETHGVTAETFSARLKDALRLYRDKCDYILVDAQAGIEEFALIAKECADTLVVVSEYDPISINPDFRFGYGTVRPGQPSAP